MSTPILLVTDRFRGHTGAEVAGQQPTGDEAGAIAAPAGARIGRGARTITGVRWVSRLAATLIVGVAVVAFLGLAVGPHLFGYRTETMLTGSMAPYISPGDVAVVTPMPVSSVRAGQVITFQAPVADRRVVSHRVTSVKTDAQGGVWIRTKGDANAAADPWTARLDGGTAWHVRAVVPHLGSAIRALRAPALHHALLYGVPGAVAAWLLVGVWRTKPDEVESV